MAAIYIASFIVALQLLWHGLKNFNWTPIKLYLLAEAIFIVYTEVRFRYKEDSNKHLPSLKPDRFQPLRTELERSDFDSKEFIKGWFYGAEQGITSDDIRDWIRGMFFNTTAQLNAEQSGILNDVFNILEQKGLELQQRKKDSKPSPMLRLTTDPPFLLVRPFLFYAGIKVAYIAGIVSLRMLGFKNKPTNHKGVHMWYRKLSNNPEKAIVLFHGLGIGLSIYIPFVILLIKEFPNHDIVLYEIASISMKLDTNYVMPSDYANLVNTSLHSLYIEKAVFIGHSLGSSCIRWVEQYHPEIIKARLFIDPICFKLWKHDLAYNAVVRWPTTAHEAIIKFIAMSEPGIGMYLRRNFVWFEVIVFNREHILYSRIA